MKATPGKNPDYHEEWHLGAGTLAASFLLPTALLSKRVSYLAEADR